MPDISEEDLRALHTLRSTVATMLKHPKAGILLEQAHKEVDPKAPTPRLEAEAARAELLAGPKKEIADLKAELAADKEARDKAANEQKLANLAARHEEGFSRLRKQHWTAEGIAGIKKVMEEHGIIDVDVAAAYYEKMHPPQALVQQGRVGGGFNLFEVAPEGDEDWKKLLETKGESEPLVDHLARKALFEHRQQAQAA